MIPCEFHTIAISIDYYLLTNIHLTLKWTIQLNVTMNTPNKAIAKINESAEWNKANFGFWNHK